MRKYFLLLVVVSSLTISASGQKTWERDTIQTTSGNLVITFLGHGSLLFNYLEKNLYVDPVRQVADYSLLPKADVILVTHEHGDHLDVEAIKQLSKEGTEVYFTQLCLPKYPSGKVCKNEEFFITQGIPVNVVAAYNISNRRGNGLPYHPKGEGNGYILMFGQTRVYVAGDTEPTPEMAKIKNVQIVFLPIAEPYTMSVYLAAEAVKKINPQVVYPYHFNNANPNILQSALEGTGIEVRIRSMK